MLSAGASAPDPMLPMPYRVVERVIETRDTVTLALTSAGAAPTLGFTPGQFTMVYVFGVGEIPVSISGDPARRDRIVHTVRAAGAVSRALCELRPGAMVGVRGPFGRAWPAITESADDVVLIGGGIGLAPLRPLVYQALARMVAGARLSVLIGARSPDDLMYPREYDLWRERGAEVLVTVDSATPAWQGQVGVVTRLIGQAHYRPERVLSMLCGPEVMMRYAAHALQDQGVPAHAIYLSLERNMKCAVGLCGHCQFGPDFVCKDGPVFALPRIDTRLEIRGV